jgi:hypothetical protein
MSLILHVALFLVSIFSDKGSCSPILIGTVSLHVSTRSARDFSTSDVRHPAWSSLSARCTCISVANVCRYIGTVFREFVSFSVYIRSANILVKIFNVFCSVP